uniref:Uncharacterized protein n=1 Tax=Arundo donax TaxID=35708 RepID=A0A0A9DL87_ARUDO
MMKQSHKSQDPSGLQHYTMRTALTPQQKFLLVSLGFSWERGRTAGVHSGDTFGAWSRPRRGAAARRGTRGGGPQRPRRSAPHRRPPRPWRRPHRRQRLVSGGPPPSARRCLPWLLS